MSHTLFLKRAVNEEQPELGYQAKVFLILQRKGIFLPVTINNIYENDVKGFVTYLQKHANQQKLMWQPFS